MPPDADALTAPMPLAAAPAGYDHALESLQQRVAQLESQLQRATAALDGLRQGIAVVDATGRIVQINAAAQASLNAGLCRADQGRLAFHLPDEQARFVKLLAAACGGADTRRAGALLVRNAVATLTISVVPLKPSHPLAHARGDFALVVLFDPAAQDDDDQHMLAGLLSLSPSETRLALMLAAGQTVQEFAVAQKCSLHTARTHLRNLMHKSGCHRQVEVVQLVQSLRLA